MKSHHAMILGLYVTLFSTIFNHVSSFPSDDYYSTQAKQYMEQMEQAKKITSAIRAFVCVTGLAISCYKLHHVSTALKNAKLSTNFIMTLAFSGLGCLLGLTNENTNKLSHRFIIDPLKIMHLKATVLSSPSKTHHDSNIVKNYCDEIKAYEQSSSPQGIQFLTTLTIIDPKNAQKINENYERYLTNKHNRNPQKWFSQRQS
ncbi:MAG: hypothetical protein WBQ73_01300 [Candidatus Babeliales bacterium]